MENQTHTGAALLQPRLVRADACGIWQLEDNMGNKKLVEVVNDPFVGPNDSNGRLHVNGGRGYWPVDSSIFDGWKWSRPNNEGLASPAGSDNPKS